MIGHFKSVKKFYSTFLFGKELPCIFLQVQKLEQTVRFPPKKLYNIDILPPCCINGMQGSRKMPWHGPIDKNAEYRKINFKNSLNQISPHIHEHIIFTLRAKVSA